MESRETPLLPDGDRTNGTGTARSPLPTGGRRPTTVDRDDLLARTLARTLTDLGASAVTAYLKDAVRHELIAVVTAVTPLGTGSVERIPVGDFAYASASAFHTGDIVTAHSVQELGSHPEMAVFAPFPFTVTSVPLGTAARRFGTLATYWPQMFRRLSEEERRYLCDVGAVTSRALQRYVEEGGSLEPPAVPRVITAEATAGAAGVAVAASGGRPAERSSPTTPLIYHLHKLANALIGTVRTGEAAELALERIVHGFHAEAMVITLTEGDRLRVVGARGCSRAFLRRLDGRPLGRRSLETDAVTQMRQIVQSPPQDGHREDFSDTADGEERDGHVWAVLPLLTGGHAIGSCSIGFRPEQTSIITEHSVLIALATLLGQTFDRTRLYDAQHTLAQKLQQALLPRMLPPLAGVQATSRYVPTSGGLELGGDWYDLINLPDGRIAAVIGDVQGHSTSAAVVMGQLRSAVRAYAAEGHGPAAILSRTNRLLVELDTDRFATCCCVRLDPDTGVAEIVSAGHHQPLIRFPDGRHHKQDADIGIPMGIDAQARYRSTQVTLAPGTLLALYTDGLAPADGTGGDAQGGSAAVRGALDDALAGSTGELETVADLMIDGISGRTAGTARADDAALLLLRYEGASAQARLHVRRLAIHRQDLQGVRRVRQFLREWLRGMGLAEIAEETELLASEVVTNALVHGDSDVAVHVRRYPDRVRVEVRDSDPHLALPAPAALTSGESENGRGLVIVSALAAAWGNSKSGRGKTVWFEVEAPAPDDPAPDDRTA